MQHVERRLREPGTLEHRQHARGEPIHARHVERALVGVTPEELRKHDDARLHVKAKVDEILSMF